MRQPVYCVFFFFSFCSFHSPSLDFYALVLIFVFPFPFFILHSFFHLFLCSLSACNHITAHFVLFGALTLLSYFSILFFCFHLVLLGDINCVFCSSSFALLCLQFFFSFSLSLFSSVYFLLSFYSSSFL